MTTETYNKVIVNCSTGEQEIMPLTKLEIDQVKADIVKADAERATQEAEEKRIADLKISAKAKLIAGEPLTEEEANLLVI